MADEDAVLFAMFPEGHAQDLTKTPAAPKKKEGSKKPAPKKVSPEAPVDASWFPVKPEPNGHDHLAACSKKVILYASLCILIFAWKQLGLMEECIATPSMLVCTGMTGFTIGKYAMR